MPRVRHYHQTPTAVPSDCDHRGVVPVSEFFSNGLIEILHQFDLFQGAKVPLHELSELHRGALPVQKHGPVASGPPVWSICRA